MSFKVFCPPYKQTMCQKNLDFVNFFGHIEKILRFAANHEEIPSSLAFKYFNLPVFAG